MSTGAALEAGPAIRDQVRNVPAAGLRNRLAAFVPLCLFGLLGWAGLLGRGATGTVWAMTGFVVLAVLALMAAAAVRAANRRRLALVGACVALLAGALLSAGVPLSLLWPEHWDELAAGLAEGLRAVPAIASPYRGADAWVERTVLLGGTLLAAIAALQAFWPARDGVGVRSPVPAAMTLTLLFGVAVIEVPPDRPYLSGAIFAALLAAFLFADRVELAQLAPAAVFVATVTLAAATVSPLVDSGAPWLDLASLSEDVANSGTVGYEWDHDYGPLEWPRDGRELLRVKAQSPAYWKAQVLDAFDGRAWRRTPRLGPFEPYSETDPGHPEWFQRIEVRFKGLRSREFVLAGQTLDLQSARRVVRVGGGTLVSERGLLRRGTVYSAQVYTPDPGQGELGRAGTDYPSDAREWLSVEIPDQRGRPRSGRPGRRPAVSFAPFGSGTADRVDSGAGGIPGFDVEGALARTGAERIYALARRLRAAVDEPYEYVQAVQERVQRGAVYTETPPVAENPLENFLFSARRGYCQQFSGAMALLLRMGGIPARVAVGFSPGSLDRRTGEYVVRDYDAHSWVEAYFPRLGWITFDPTPAAAPPREQAADRELALAGGRRGRSAEGDRLSDPGAGGAANAAGRSLWVPVVGILMSALVGLGLVVLRRGRDRRSAVAPELAELERALRVSGRRVGAGVTLAELERQLALSAEAGGYLRAIASQRFGVAGRPPTERERRAMRRDLASGLGRSGLLRAWWAMPPRLLRTRAAAS